MLNPIFVTHYSPQAEYGDIAPPSGSLIEKTISSIQSHVVDFSSDIVTDPLIVYNKPKDSHLQAEGAQYEQNIRGVIDDTEIELHTKLNEGLRPALQYALKKTSAPYVMFVEHDWEFLQNIDIRPLLRVFENNSEINYVRFNKWENSVKGNDTIVEETASYDIPLCKVSSFSNNPHIARRNPYTDWIENSEPSLGHVYRSLRRPRGSYSLRQIWRIFKNYYVLDKSQVKLFDGIEYVVDTKFENDIRKLGFEQAHSRMGTYLYGGKMSGPYVRHLGR
jgi:hypothetical protein